MKEKKRIYLLLFLLSFYVLFFDIFLIFYDISVDNLIKSTRKNIRFHSILVKKLIFYQNKKPLKILREGEPKLTAGSAISVFLKNNQETIVYQKNENVILPIASLTKLMTAIISYDNYKLSDTITFTKKAVDQIGDVGNYKVGETFTIEGLLHSILMESSNDAAELLSEKIGSHKFIDLMNKKAKEIGMESTFFYNPTGLPSKSGENVSTVKDLAKLTEYLLKKYPKILEISSKREYNLYKADKKFHHKIINKDSLLKKQNNLGVKIILSKTGYTKSARECLDLAIEFPQKEGKLINIILKSENRESDMIKLIDWLKTAIIW